MRSRLEDLENELKEAQKLNYIIHLDLLMSCATVHFSPCVSDTKIKKIIAHINRTYKDVAWVPASLYYNDTRKKIKIHYKRDFS